MVEFQIVVLWLAIYSVGYSRCQLELPHPTCSYGPYDDLVENWLFCEADLDISVNLIPSNVALIVLWCPSASKENQCNMMRGDVQPLPYSKELAVVSLSGFRTDNAQYAQPNQARIPVPQFLHNVKHNLVWLQILYSKIGYLDGAFFRGFQSLLELELIGNDISTIDVESFQFLMDPLVPTPGAASDLPIPKLYKVDLTWNDLQDLDWAVFKPVARTMDYIRIAEQQPGLTSLRRTGQPFSMKLTNLKLNGNSISEIPDAVLDTIVSGITLDAQKNNMCSFLPSGDCSCCEMANLVKWTARNAKSSWVKFSCGNGSSQITQHSKFPLAMFAKCEETDTTRTFPYRSCYTPQPLRIECSLGRFELRSSTRATTDATTVIFASDGQSQCDNILYGLHNKVLEMAGIPTARAAGDDSVHVVCQNGTLRVSERGTLRVSDPDASTAHEIVFQADSSLSCHVHLHEFSGFIIALPQNNPGNCESSPILPINVWLSDFLICTDAQPLVVNCTGGVLTSSEKNLTHSAAITMLLYTDHSFDCRTVLKNVHEHILRQEAVQIDSYIYAEQEDAVVAVVQHGVTVISENQPNKSTKRNLRFYSAPNQLSRNKFRRLTGFLQSLFGTGIV